MSMNNWLDHRGPERVISMSPWHIRARETDEGRTAGAFHGLRHVNCCDLVARAAETDLCCHWSRATGGDDLLDNSADSIWFPQQIGSAMSLLYDIAHRTAEVDIHDADFVFLR